jgi:hypothetical protein
MVRGPDIQHTRLCEKFLHKFVKNSERKKPPFKLEKANIKMTLREYCVKARTDLIWIYIMARLCENFNGCSVF